MKQNHTIREIIHELEARVRSNRRWRVVATCLASVVVFTTVYLLVLPAITIQTSDDLSGAGIELTSVEDSQGSVTNSGAQPLAEGDVTSGDVTSGDVPADDTSSATQPGSDGNASTGDGGTTGDSATTDDGTAANDGAQDVSQPSGSTGEATPQPEGSSSADVAGETTPNQPASNDGAETLAGGDDVSADEDMNDDTLVSENSNIVGTVVATGTIDSADIPAQKITWTVSDDDRGERTLTISGSGKIPDYSNTSDSVRPPWYQYTATLTDDIVIEEGITSVGTFAFDYIRATGSLTLPSTLTEIKTKAFQTNNFSEPLVIPGNVLSVGANAFTNNRSLPSVTIEANKEGLGQSVDLNAFAEALVASSESYISISSTVKSIQIAYTCRAGEIRVEQGNPNYFDIDGVLYSYEGGNEDQWCLERYPAYKMDVDTFVVPDSVVRIEDVAFQSVKGLRAVTVPDKDSENDLDVEIPVYLLYLSDIQEAYIGDRAVLENRNALDHMFDGCQKLLKVTLPETLRWEGGGSSLTMSNTFMNCYVLQEVTIPKEVTNIGSAAFQNCSNLTKVTFNSSNVVAYPANIGGSSATAESPCQFELTIGADVDNLATGFNAFSECATSVVFQGSNSIIVEDGAFDGMPIPLKGLSGTLYVDEDGLVYLCDTDAHVAELVYVPPVNSATVVDSFDIDGQQYSVTSVRQNSLAAASGLVSLTFMDPAAITHLDTYALGNCPTLTEINDKERRSDVEALFDNAQSSINDTTFFNTGLREAFGGGNFEDHMQGGQNLEVTAPEGSNAAPLTISILQDESPTAEWRGNKDESVSGGGWYFLTGDTMKSIVNVGNTSGTAEHVYRVYIRWTTSLASLNWKSGQSATYGDPGEETTVFCHATDDPYVCCLEFKVEAGKTVSFPIDALYPSPTSPGGGIVMWAEIVDDSELTDSDAQIAVSTPDNWANALYGYWYTDPDTFDVSKTNDGKTIELTGDGDGTIRPASGIVWSITHKRSAEDSSSYGKDYLTSYELSDTVTLPKNVSWDIDVIAAIKAGNVSFFTTNANSWYTTTFRANGVDIATVATYNDQCTGYDLTLDEQDNPVFTWTNRNTNGTPAGSEAMTFPEHRFTLLPAAITIDPDGYDPEAANLSNAVTSVSHYHWNDDHESNGEATAKLGEITSSLVLDKTASEDAYYFGEDIDYTITLSNVGAATYEAEQAGSFTLVDQVSDYGYLYIKPENIERLFQELPEGVSLEVTISDAKLKGWEKVADALKEENISYKTPNNTTGFTDGGNHVLTIRKSGESNGFALYVDGGGPKGSGTDLAGLLQSAGYDVTWESKYKLTWTLNEADTSFTLHGDEELTFNVRATAKSTFELLGADWPNQFPENTTMTFINKVDLYDQNGVSGPDGTQNTALRSDSVSTELHREATIEKHVSKVEGGATEPIDSGSFTVQDGDMLEYSFTFTHYGSGAYDHLPFVDDMYGAQALLVPTEENEHLAKEHTELKQVSIDNRTYYRLDQPGETYNDVFVGIDDEGNTWRAESVEVSGGGSSVSVGGGATHGGEEGTEQEYTYDGLHTKISWYRASLPGNSYQFTLTYRALVDSALDNDGSYDIGNIIWANDKQDYRIYDAIWGGGSIISFDKDIIENKGTDPDDGSDDVLVTSPEHSDGKYSIVNRGSTVTYRITLENSGNRKFVLSGSNLADQLPRTFNNTTATPTFDWKKDENVKISYLSTSPDTVISKGFFEDGWSIGNSYAGIPQSNGQQYILWDQGQSITFAPNSKVYIYVELTFPNNNADEGITTWTDYVDAANGSIVQNALWVYRFSTQVTHTLFDSGYVLLQKGVHSTGVWDRYNYERNEFSTYDNQDHIVTYYVALLNAGTKRLYLNTIYDDLPAGFAFRNLSSTGRLNTTNGSTNQDAGRTTTTVGGVKDSGDANPVTNNYMPLVNLTFTSKGEPQQITYRCATVTADTTDGLKFTFGAGSGDYAVRYDEEREKYYLDCGEAIVFAYTLNIGTKENPETDDPAENTIGMPYDDYLGSGVVYANMPEAEKDGNVQASVVGYKNGTSVTTNNDGQGDVESAGTMKNEHQLTDPANDAWWLSSSVSIRRGTIAPDLTKTAASYTESVGADPVELEPGDSVPTDATVNWEIRAINNGKQNMVDYVVSDRLPYPYVFVGSVYKSTYEMNDTALNENNEPVIIIEDHSIDDETVRVSGPASKQWEGVEVNLDTSSWGELSSAHNKDGWYSTYSESIDFRLYRDDDGREVLELRFKSPGGAIPEDGGYAKVKLSSKNGTTNYVNTVYTNSAYIRLFEDTGETWTNPSEGKLEGTEEGQHQYVTNSWPINVSSGMATTSHKEVAEVGVDPSNSASSATGASNRITLGDAANEFTYTLEVNNTSGFALDKLVLIDNLPEVGDVNPFDPTAVRGSGFDVMFSETVNLVVKVTYPDTSEDAEEGAVKTDTLTLGREYSVGYQQKNGQQQASFTEADWNGENAGAWNNVAGNDMRSLRVIIGGDDGYKVPKDAVVRVSFDAVAAGDAEPAAIAWNNFGYHYELTSGTQVISLSALALRVGVQVPSAPILIKQLVDDQGNELVADDDFAFRFVVYVGEALQGSYASEAELIAALVADSRNYRIVEIKVPSGSSESDPLYLRESVMNELQSDGMAPWDWSNNGTYTITELPTGNGLTFKSFNNVENVTHEFTYKDVESHAIVCVNEETIWTLSVHKVNGSNTSQSLTGAVFALYSPEEDDALTKEKYEELLAPYGDLDIKTVLTEEDLGSDHPRTGYLVDVKKIEDKNGILSFEELERDRYYLLEVQAPDGFNLPDVPGQIVRRSDATAGLLEITVSNFPGYDLPSTGGPGTTLFTLGGVALMGAACIAGYRKRSRKGDGPCC